MTNRGDGGAFDRLSVTPETPLFGARFRGLLHHQLTLKTGARRPTDLGLHLSACKGAIGKGDWIGRYDGR